jgi:arylsulfatase A-like enzyme
MGSAAAVAAGWLVLLIPYLALTIGTSVRQGVGGSLLFRVGLYEAGHMLLLALATSAVVWAWVKIVPARFHRWSDVVIAIVALCVAAALLPLDMEGFVTRQRAAGSNVPWTPVVIIGAALALVAAANVRRLPKWLRLGAIVGALTVGAAQRSIQPLDYLGAHAYLSWISATAIAGAMVGTPTPSWIPRLSGPQRVAAIIALWALGVSSLAMPPSRAAWAHMNRLPGAPLVTELSAMRLRSIDEATAMELGPWWQRRDALPATEPSRPLLLGPDAIVILITIDALRADVVNAGRHEEQLPALTKLRNESVNFVRARTPSPSTATSITTMLSGLYYSQLYWSRNESERWRGRILPHEDESVRFPALLTDHGVHTVHILADHGLDFSSGISNGFEVLRKTRHNDGPAKEQMTLMLDELGKVGDGPAFFYAHFLEPHAPYNRAGKHGTPYERYLREVALVDKELGRLGAFLEERGLTQRTMLIVSADHGEAFGEHGMSYHARSLYDELLRVPLLFHHHALEPRRVEEDVGLVDLGATVLDLMGVPTPGHLMGQSLVAFLRGQEAHLDRPIAADSGRRMQSIIFDDGTKAIIDLQRRTEEVYDLDADPGETRNLLDEPGSHADEYLDRLLLFFHVHTLQRPGGYTPPPRRF